jgi:hypothetical protein
MPQLAKQRDLRSSEAQRCHHACRDQRHDALGLHEDLEEPLANDGHVH